MTPDNRLTGTTTWQREHSNNRRAGGQGTGQQPMQTPLELDLLCTVPFVLLLQKPAEQGRMQQRAPGTAGLTQNQKLAGAAAVLGLGYWMYSRRQGTQAWEWSIEGAPGLPRQRQLLGRCPPERRRRQRCGSCPAAIPVTTGPLIYPRLKRCVSLSPLLAAKPRTWAMQPAGRAPQRGAPSRLPAKRCICTALPTRPASTQTAIT